MAPLMIVCGAVVAGVVGITGNIVASDPPAWLSRWALPLFLVASLLGVVVGLAMHWSDRRAAPAARSGELTGRDRFRLLDRVAGQAADVLWLPPGDPPALRLGLCPRAELVSAARPHFADRLGDGSTIEAAYEHAQHALLVVGGPGSGKSRLVAELTAHLVAVARAEPDAPVPVLVSLAGWAPERGPLTGWLVRELQQRYDVPDAIGAAAVAAGQVQPLLDGLDESADVAACVAAVNAFRAGHGLVPVVVCSRLVEYERCGARLRLRGAVELRPPAAEDVRRYLDQAGVPAATVDALERDMGELLSTPLTLGLIGRTARSGGTIELADSADRAQRWVPLFDAYIERMLRRARDPGARDGGAREYTEAEVRRWLGWLAGATGGQFRLDRVQPLWLPPDAYRVWDRLQRWWQALPQGFGYGLLGGLTAGWAAGRLGLPAPIWWGVAASLVVAVVPMARSARKPARPVEIEPAEVLRWTRRGLFEAIGVFAVLMPFMAVIAVLTALLGGKPWSSVWSRDTFAPLVLMLLIFLVFGCTQLVETGLAPASRVPNEGIRRSLRHALLAGVAGAAAAGAMVLAAGATVLPEIGLGTAAAAGVTFGVVVGHSFGGGAAMAHYTVRALLVRSGCAPWRYVRFLDYATERVLLRRVGGAYEFIHPTLRDHLTPHPHSDAVSQ